MKGLFKRLFKSAFFRFLMVWAAAQYIRIVYYTSRRRIDIDESAKPALLGDQVAVYAFWHSRLMMMPMMNYSKRHMNVLISSHRDGEMIARTMHRFGFSTVRGSTSKNAVMAGKGAAKALRRGENVSFTPDGPRGPARKAQDGVAVVANLARVPVLPLTFSSTRNKRARSWDKFMIALPFGTLYFKAGPLIWNPTPEAVEAALNKITDEADRNAGVIP